MVLDAWWSQVDLPCWSRWTAAMGVAVMVECVALW